MNNFQIPCFFVIKVCSSVLKSFSFKTENLYFIDEEKF